MFHLSSPRRYLEHPDGSQWPILREQFLFKRNTKLTQRDRAVVFLKNAPSLTDADRRSLYPIEFTCRNINYVSLCSMALRSACAHPPSHTWSSRRRVTQTFFNDLLLPFPRMCPLLLARKHFTRYFCLYPLRCDAVYSTRSLSTFRRKRACSVAVEAWAEKAYKTEMVRLRNVKGLPGYISEGGVLDSHCC